MAQYDVTDLAARLVELEAQRMFRGIPVADVERCAHCGGPRRGFAQINDAKVCHTDPPFPDCYRLVTVYGERLGDRHPDRIRESIAAAIEAASEEALSDGASMTARIAGLDEAARIARGES